MCEPEACPLSQRSVRPLSQKNWGFILIFYLCSVMGMKACPKLSDCHSSMGPRNASSPGIQSQVTKGCPLGGSHQNQGTRYLSKLLSRRHLFSAAQQRESIKMAPNGCGKAEGKHKYGACCKKNQKIEKENKEKQQSLARSRQTKSKKMVPGD